MHRLEQNSGLISLPLPS